MFNLIGENPLEIFRTILLAIAALAISISVHESAHAWMANRLGDPTARHLGRISLNPLVHIDLLGTIIVPILFLLQAGILFGWAKPTPFNPWNLKNPRADAALISLAGPASNLVLATVFGLAFRAFAGNDLVAVILFRLITLNLVLAFFNLLPIPPLDGFKVVGGILPRSLASQWESLERYGILILLAFFFFGAPIIQPLLGFFVGSFLQIITGASLSL